MKGFFASENDAYAGKDACAPSQDVFFSCRIGQNELFSKNARNV